MPSHDDANMLFLMASKDLSALNVFIDSSEISEEIFGFHAQQAVEKVLKAWIAARGWQYPYGHDITALLRVLEKHSENVAMHWDFAELNPFAVQFRYEAFVDLEEKPLDRNDILERVNSLFRHVEKLISNCHDA